MSSDGLCHLNPDCESTTDAPTYNTTEKPEMGERSDGFITKDFVTHDDMDSIIFLVKECEEVESGVLTNSTSSDNQLLQNEMDQCGDQSKGLTAASAAAATSTGSQNKLKMKSCLGGGAEENHQGFQTPTDFLHSKLSSTALKCPPAPRKPKAEPLGKRKRERRNLQLEFVNEVELVLRLLGSGDPKLKKARLVAASEGSASSLGS
uniref:Uncharacterized protein n=1 Tax=Kalanchoe fedtschenkoi TaxID=63787 RepID=A0A7N0ZTX2_KALFE